MENPFNWRRPLHMARCLHKILPQPVVTCDIMGGYEVLVTLSSVWALLSLEGMVLGYMGGNCPWRTVPNTWVLSSCQETLILRIILFLCVIWVLSAPWDTEDRTMEAAIRGRSEDGTGEQDQQTCSVMRAAEIAIILCHSPNEWPYWRLTRFFWQSALEKVKTCQENVSNSNTESWDIKGKLPP